MENTLTAVYHCNNDRICYINQKSSISANYTGEICHKPDVPRNKSMHFLSMLIYLFAKIIEAEDTD